MIRYPLLFSAIEGKSRISYVSISFMKADPDFVSYLRIKYNGCLSAERFIDSLSGDLGRDKDYEPLNIYKTVFSLKGFMVSDNPRAIEVFSLIEECLEHKQGIEISFHG